MVTREVLILMCCLLPCSADAATPAGNLLVNGDFERGLEGWQTAKPPGGTIEIAPSPRGQCARLNSTDRSNSTYLIQTLDPQRIKGKRIRVDALMKAENVVVGTYPYSQAKITLVWNDGKHDHDHEIDFLYTFDWRKVSVVWTIGDDCAKAALYLGMHTTTGTVWFDDVVLSVPELKAEKVVTEGVKERVYEDGGVLYVNGREFTEVKLKPPEPPDSFRPTPGERARGFAVFRTEEPASVVPGTVPTRAQVIDAFDLLAAPDEYEPLTFALFALSPLKRVVVEPGELVGPRGAAIPASAFDARMGKYVLQRVGYTSPDYYVVPKLLVKSAEVDVAPERPQLFWLTLHVPPDAAAGSYAGAVRIRADGKEASLPVRLRVLPFRLVRSKPWMLFFYNNHPDDAELYFRDMRDHGMTSVILGQVMAPIRRAGERAVVDFTTSDAFVDAYRKAGFTDPLVYNPFHDRLATKLLELWGLADGHHKEGAHGELFCVFKEGEYPEHLHEVYRQVVRDIFDHAKQAGWPPMLFYPVDEPNDPDSWRMTAARLEYRLAKEAVPGARTFCTVYSIPVMERLDPWLDVRACHLVHPAASEEQNRKFHNYVRRAGGELWGIEWPAMWDDFWRARELAGFLPAKAGVTAMTAWTYYNPAPWKDEYADLRGELKQCLLSYRDADGSLIPTVTWEGLRAGVTDWRYFATLEEAIAKANGAKRERGEQILREVIVEVPWRTELRKDWGDRRASQLRAKIAEAILSLSSPR
ncbi:MAG: hypothetical protein GW911_25290 [Armatimonadetes bacterium]|nr:hypothetical protein [Armatimonadota bacterium]PIY43206.1 MAG: hypothetical protein COZ05_11745 [Armatimonadetes bacterium CG_4_10_14_3_um_filter_59_10]PJB64930.1 MAG: hypothetical protein CO096_19280 [Armatimonadetes bacterium CG_4_9_14_3_um_filter_66_14]